MSDLSPHRDEEQDAEVDEENRPEDRDVEEGEEGCGGCERDGLGRRVPADVGGGSAGRRARLREAETGTADAPELELWQPADERAELAVLELAVRACAAGGRAGRWHRGGQAGCAFLDLGLGDVGSESRVELWLEEREEQVEEVDPAREWAGARQLGATTFLREVNPARPRQTQRRSRHRQGDSPERIADNEVGLDGEDSDKEEHEQDGRARPPTECMRSSPVCHRVRSAPRPRVRWRSRYAPRLVWYSCSGTRLLQTGEKSTWREQRRSAAASEVAVEGADEVYEAVGVRQRG